MGRLDNNATLLNALHNNTPFVYAYLVKFQKPVNNLEVSKSVASNEYKTLTNAGSEYVYLTDGAFDIVFDDGETDSNGVSHGARTYLANKVMNIGTIADSADLKLSNTSITLDTTPVDTSLTDGITTAIVGSSVEITAANSSFSDAGFREGDTVSFTIGTNSGYSFVINNFKNEGKTIGTRFE